jgi:hypothetical protein
MVGIRLSSFNPLDTLPPFRKRIIPPDLPLEKGGTYFPLFVKEGLGEITRRESDRKILDACGCIGQPR